MPYAAAVVVTKNASEEDDVEALVGGGKKTNGTNARLGSNGWPAIRNAKSNDHMSTIFVHPPTPEREVPPATSAASSSSAAAPSTSLESFANAVPTSVASTTLPPVVAPTKLNSAALPLQVLPEVRSPPRKSLAMAADSLQIAQRRGRRPRLFGFTELPESSGSSANSSRNASPAVSLQGSPAGSRSNSPDRASPLVRSIPVPSPAASTSSTATITSSTYAPSPAPGPAFIPRRHPIRARSENSLTTVNMSRSVSSGPQTTSLPRRKDNGLKLDFTGIIPLSKPQEVQSARVIPSPYSSTLIRKKSGEILKSALKYAGPLNANGTPVQNTSDLPDADGISPLDTPGSERRARFGESKSCPTTPSCPKYVHFDAQLERVKLFLHDQKPQVVSRDGSPTAEYTTSEGEEFPFPQSTDDEAGGDGRVLQIKLPNFPTSHPPESELYLESFYLDDDRKTLRGILVCKNLAFQKWVAVRFTFDWWQTTSEVSATHKDSIRGGTFDRFQFSIKLHDLLSRIEEKTLFLAVRYNTDGREIWDSNGGQNYQVLFERKKVDPSGGKKGDGGMRSKVGKEMIGEGRGRSVGGRSSQWSVTGDKDGSDRMADLRAKLSRLSADDGSSPPQLSPLREKAYLSFGSQASSPRRSFSGAADSGSKKGGDLPSAGPALAARYDFGEAFSRTQKRNSSTSPGGSPSARPADLPEVRTGLLSFAPPAAARAPHGYASMEFYSPKYSPSGLPGALSPIGPSFGGANAPDAGFFGPNTVSPAMMGGSSMPSPAIVPDLHIQGPSPPPPDEDSPTASSHLTLKPVTPASPKRPGMIHRHHTSPANFVHSAPVHAANTSPPQLSTSSTNDTPSDSPRSPPDPGSGLGVEIGGAASGVEGRWSPTMPAGTRDAAGMGDSYKGFIEQFCWAGSSSSSFSSTSSDPPRRVNSTSALDEYFSPLSATSLTPSGGSGGQTTPKAADGHRRAATPSTTSTYYTGFSTPNGRDDMEAVEGVLRGSPSPARGWTGTAVC